MSVLLLLLQLFHVVQVQIVGGKVVSLVSTRKLLINQRLRSIVLSKSEELMFLNGFLYSETFCYLLLHPFVRESSLFHRNHVVLIEVVLLSVDH